MKTRYGIGVKLAVVVCLLGSYAWAAPISGGKTGRKMPGWNVCFCRNQRM